MKDQETIQKFIELRSQGWTYARLMAELNVSKPTLINWSRKFPGTRVQDRPYPAPRLWLNLLVVSFPALGMIMGQPVNHHGTASAEPGRNCGRSWSNHNR